MKRGQSRWIGLALISYTVLGGCAEPLREPPRSFWQIAYAEEPPYALDLERIVRGEEPR